MKKLPMIVAAILLFAVSLSGCIGGVAGTPVPAYTASPAMDPSRIISLQEAESLVGNALKPALVSPTAPPFVSAAPAAATPAGTGTPAPSVGPTQTPAYSNFVMCFYESAEKGGKFLQISVLQVTPAMVPPQGQQASQDLSALGQYNAVKGIGPSTTGDPLLMIDTNLKGKDGKTVDAFILAPGLHLYYRGYYVVIGVGDPNDSAIDAILDKAGQLAVNNIDTILDGAASTPTPTPTSAT